MAVIAVVFGLLAWRQAQTTRDARDLAAAAGLRTVQQAVATVITRNFDAVVKSMAQCPSDQTSCPPGSVQRFTPASPLPGLAATTLQSLGLLPPGFAAQNVHGQSYEIWLRRTDVARLEGLVLTVGGTALNDSRATEIATRADPSDGGVVSAGNIVKGAYGAWAIDLQSYVSADPVHLLPPGPGHAAALLRFDDSRAYADYIHRFAIGGDTEPQTMHTTLDMGGKSISNAGDLTVRYSIAIQRDDQIAVNGDCSGKEGRVASAASNEPVICVIEGPSRIWRRVALLPSCSANQFISVDSSGRLSCSS